MKKKLSFVLVLGIFCSTLAFSGCSLFEKKVQTAFATFTIYYSENTNIEYKVNSTDMNFGKISVPYHPTGYYYAKYEVYYRKSKQLILSKDLWYIHVNTNEIGEHQITDHAGVNGRMELYGVVATVEDTRIAPTIVLEPNGAIEYTENARYVYKYDGNPHHPRALYCVYEGDVLEISGYELLLNENWQSARYLREVGVYEVFIRISNDDYTNLTIDNRYIATTIVDFTIEIIE